MGPSQLTQPADQRQSTEPPDHDTHVTRRRGRSAGARQDSGAPSKVGALLLELAFAVLISVLVSAGLQSIVARITISSHPTYVPQALTTVFVGVVVALLVWVIRGPARRHLVLTVPVLLATITSLSLALPLLGTRLYFGGLSVDQEFRTQYVTRLTSSPALADMNYAHLASYYPAGWFWLAGRFAALTGMPGWAAYKPFAIISMAAMSAVGFVLWKLVLPRRQAALAALATSLVGVLAGADEPYAWIGASALAPVSIIAWHLLRCRKRWHWAGLAGIGVFLGITALTYTLYCLFFGLLLATFAGTAVIRQTRSGDGWGAALGAALGRLIPIGLVAGAIASVFWAQYLVSMLHAGTRSGVAQHYLPPDSTLLPTPMLQATALGVLCLIGTVWLLISFRDNDIAAALGTTSILVYVWFALSTLALAAHTTLLAFRLNLVLLTLLAPAGVLGALALYRWLRDRLDGTWTVHLRTLLFSAAVIGAVAIAQTGPQVHADDISSANKDYYPTGVNAVGESDPSQPGAWNGQLRQAIAQLSNRQPADLVVLSTYSTLLSYEPYWGFQQQTPHYANPLADYPRRASEITGWTTATDSADLVRRLDRCPDTPPTVFVLQRKSDGLHMGLHSDIFPAQPNVATHDVVFRANLFHGPEFQTRDVGPYTVIVRQH